MWHFECDVGWQLDCNGKFKKGEGLWKFQGHLQFLMYSNSFIRKFLYNFVQMENYCENNKILWRLRGGSVSSAPPPVCHFHPPFLILGLNKGRRPLPFQKTLTIFFERTGGKLVISLFFSIDYRHQDQRWALCPTIFHPISFDVSHHLLILQSQIAMYVQAVGANR